MLAYIFILFLLSAIFFFTARDCKKDDNPRDATLLAAIGLCSTFGAIGLSMMTV